jgi:acylphosphatase
VRRAETFRIEGRVQGVGYRWWAQGEASRLGLSGWVRNRRDGSVELLAIGDPDAIDRLAERCRAGPAAAAVVAVTRSEGQDDGSEGFEERATV